MAMSTPPNLRQVYADLIEAAEDSVESDEAFADENIRDAMKGMWLDAGVQQAVAKGHEFALHDNLTLSVS